MKAIITEKYGSPDVLKFKEIEKPIPKDDEILIKVYASSVNAFDWHMLRADPFFIRLMSGLIKPKLKILGADIAGRVESVGKNVTQFKPGDEVFGDLSSSGCGGFAEFAVVQAKAVVSKPENLTFEQAAAVPLAAVTALQGLRDQGEIQSGQKVLIIGASGGVGTYAVQIAKAFGAEVTAVCSTRNLEIARSIGADYVVDYNQEDLSKFERSFDLVYVANGNNSISACKRALKENGILVMAGGTMAQLYRATVFGPLIFMTGTKKMRGYVAKPNQKDLAFITELLETGKVKSVIDKQYPLSETADAIRYLEEGHTQGKVVISVHSD